MNLIPPTYGPRSLHNRRYCDARWRICHQAWHVGRKNEKQPFLSRLTSLPRYVKNSNERRITPVVHARTGTSACVSVDIGIPQLSHTCRCPRYRIRYRNKNYSNSCAVYHCESPFRRSRGWGYSNEFDPTNVWTTEPAQQALLRRSLENLPPGVTRGEKEWETTISLSTH